MVEEAPVSAEADDFFVLDELPVVTDVLALMSFAGVIGAVAGLLATIQMIRAATATTIIPMIIFEVFDIRLERKYADKTDIASGMSSILFS